MGVFAVNSILVKIVYLTKPYVNSRLVKSSYGKTAFVTNGNFDLFQ